jgi:hypothetical protein
MIFKLGRKNQIPSSYHWEKLLYDTGGYVDRATLMKVFDQSKVIIPNMSVPVLNNQVTTAPTVQSEEKEKICH